jgi:hypothetical protein
MVRVSTPTLAGATAPEGGQANSWQDVHAFEIGAPIAVHRVGAARVNEAESDTDPSCCVSDGGSMVNVTAP